MGGGSTDVPVPQLHLPGLLASRNYSWDTANVNGRVGVRTFLPNDKYANISTPLYCLIVDNEYKVG